MRAWQVVRHGEPREALALAEIPPPEPGPGQLRVRVAAAGLGLPDVFLCRGSYAFRPELPFTPGQEVVGTVSATTEGGPAPGTRVVAVTAFFLGRGGFADEALALSASTYPAPEQLSDAAAAGFAIPYHTAWLGLVRRGGLAAGDWLVVHGAAGGSGAAAVQVGRALGARVVAVAGGAEKVAACQALGADLVVDHRERDFVEAVREATGGRGADVVYDPVGGEVFRRSVSCLANEGRLLAVGFASGSWGDASTAGLVRANASAVGVYVGAYDHEAVSRAHAALCELLAAGRIRPAAAAEVPFEDLPDALQALAERRAVGKTVLRVA